MKEKQQTYKQASQELFGKWRYLAENFGAVLIIAALLWMLFAPNSGGIALLLMLGGFLYTLVIDGIIKRHVDG